MVPAVAGADEVVAGAADEVVDRLGDVVTLACRAVVGLAVVGDAQGLGAAGVVDGVLTVVAADPVGAGAAESTRAPADQRDRRSAGSRREGSWAAARPARRTRRAQILGSSLNKLQNSVDQPLLCTLLTLHPSL